MFTVKQLARMAGVTPRTLHHYDAIDLLKPARIGENGYRYYGQEELLRLQQTLFYRELGLPLDQIVKIIGSRDFDVLDALWHHREGLISQIKRLKRLIKTVDNTIHHLQRRKDMNEKEIFAGFSEAEQEKYALEAEQLYGSEVVRASMKKWKGYTKTKQAEIFDEGRRIYQELIAVMPKGSASQEAQALIRRWREHIEKFWKPADAQLVALADGFVNEPRFRKFYDKLHPDLAVFISDAVRIYVENRKRND